MKTCNYVINFKDIVKKKVINMSSFEDSMKKHRIQIAVEEMNPEINALIDIYENQLKQIEERQNKCEHHYMSVMKQMVELYEMKLDIGTKLNAIKEKLSGQYNQGDDECS